MSDTGYSNHAMDLTDENEKEPASPDSDYDELFSFSDGEGTLPYLPEDTSSPEIKDIDGVGKAGLPFNFVHNPPKKFKDPQRNVFVPGNDIKVQIVDYERSITTHLLHPNLYTIEFQHGDFTWTVKKRYSHIQNLHQQLKLFRASLNIPFPTRAHRERRTSFRNEPRTPGSKKSKGALPRFPNKPEALVPYENIDERIIQLESYLRNLLQIKMYREHPETVLFLEVSHMSFICGLGMKGKEGMIRKRTGSTQPGRSGCNFCGIFNNVFCVRCKYLCNDLCGGWRERWLFVKDTYLGYIRPKDGHVKCILLFDSGFEVSSGMYGIGLHQLQILSLSRLLVIKCWTRRKRKEWMAYLKDVAMDQARDFTLKNPHNSFAPPRLLTDAAWFVDGSSYMEAVADALEAAEEEIYIADWWLSPEIYMKRPITEDNHWRLDRILARKAENGVKVFVMLYKEVELALGINSFYSKQKLAGSHPNIKVLRHPDHAKAGVFFWAHHEKIVVVDQTYAFVGGLDLCYGRWDSHEHRLTDLGSVSQSLSIFPPLRRKQTSSHPMADTPTHSTVLKLALATNLITVGVLSSSQANLATSLEEVPLPPQPELDSNHALILAEQSLPDRENMKCDTPPPERRHLFEKMKDTTERKTKEWMNRFYRGNDDSEEEPDVKITLDGNLIASETDNRLKEDGEAVEATGPQWEETPKIGGRRMKRAIHYEDDKELCDEQSQLVGVAKYWIGKDYTNFIVKDFNNLDEPYQDLVDRGTTPRMPWHDIGVMVQGAAARDVARHFIQRWNAIKLEKAKITPFYPYLIPKSYDDVKDTSHVIPSIIKAKLRRVQCQVLRSVSHWSSGFLDMDTWEESIHEAYVEAITNARHYVYIENQFFITLAMHNHLVKNQVGETLFKRIIRAHKEGSTFRVYVVMPLLPGFEGEVGSPTGTALHAITHWNYASICRGKDSIMQRLKDSGIPDPSEYISFYGLRTHSLLNGDLVTELIYVHSKLLIVDDMLVICGSANINDRSLIGKRDSEIAVIIQDYEFENGVMNGKLVKCGKYAGSLRRHVFREHLGQLIPKDPGNRVDVKDPVSSHFYYDVWMKTATCNTRIYEEVFHCIPTDSATTFQNLKKFQDTSSLCHQDPLAATKLLEGVKGHLVNLPLNFLSNEVLTPNAGTVEGLMPTTLWT